MATMKRGNQVMMPFFAPVIAFVVAVCLSLLVPVRGYAQVTSTSDFVFQRMMSKVVSGSAAGMQVGADGKARIISGGRFIAEIGFREKRLASVATVAKYAARLSGVGVASFILGELAEAGLEWASGQWMFRPPIQTHTFTGSVPSCSETLAAGMQAGANAYFVHTNGITTYHVMMIGDWGKPGFVVPSGYSGGSCYPVYPLVAGYATGIAWKNVTSTPIPQNPQSPATQANKEQAWDEVLRANPNFQETVWGYLDIGEQNKLWEEALAQPAEVLTGSPAYSQPATTQIVKVLPSSATETTTQTRQTEYTAVPNADPATLKARPILINEKTTTTKTLPDGSTETSVEERVDESPDQQDRPSEEKIIVCGLPDTPPCKIDETGTKTAADAVSMIEAKESALDDFLDGANSAASSVMAQVDSSHESASAHFISVFDVMPTFGNEVCQPLSWSDGDRTMKIDFCEYYYVAKDVFSVFVAMGFVLSSIFMVAGAIRV